MNKRQKKKAFKRKYGINPPKGAAAYKIHLAAKAIVKIWDGIKKALARFGEAIRQIIASLPKEHKIQLTDQADMECIQCYSKKGGIKCSLPEKESQQ